MTQDTPGTAKNTESDTLVAGTVLESLTVSDLTVEGQGLARYTQNGRNRVVFLDGGLPGAVVDASVSGVRSGVLRASIIRETQPSPLAVQPWCPHAGECGACDWQHFAPEALLEWKRKHVEQTLARLGGIRDLAVPALLPSPEERAYRNKMVYAFAPGPQGEPQLGLRKKRARTLVEVTACGMQPAPAMDILAETRKLACRLGLRAWQGPLDEQGRRVRERASGYLRFLTLRMPSYTPGGTARILLECITGTDHDGPAVCDGTGQGERLCNAEAVERMAETLLRQFPLSGFVHSERSQTSEVGQGERVVRSFGSTRYQERFGHLLLEVPHDVFLQTNSGAAARLYAAIEAELEPGGGQCVWDIYSGVGSIGLYLARRAGAVFGLEIQAAAVHAARKNAAALGYTHCHFQKGVPDPQKLQSLPPPDCIILDPPRAGLDAGAVQALCQVPASAAKLVYVSCDPGTQARDAARLRPHWQPVRCQSVDMFPYTPHVENMLVFERVR